MREALARRVVRGLLPRDLARPVLADLDRELEGRRARGARMNTLWLLREGVRLALRLRTARALEAVADRRAPSTTLPEPTMDVLLADLRLALRRLVSAPTITVASLLTLALGIGASTAFFSVVDAVLLRPLPYAHPEGLVRVQGGSKGVFGDWLSQPEIIDLRERVGQLAVVGGYGDGSANLTGAGEPERLAVSVVMPELFGALGVSAARGRTFTAEEGRKAGAAVVLLSDALFQRRFAGDPTLVGRTIQLDGHANTVVGVLPADFRLPTEFKGAPSELYLPLVLDLDSLQARGSHYIHTFARLAPGATAANVQAPLASVGAALTAEGDYDAAAGHAFRAVPLRENVLGDVRPALAVLLGAVGFLLLIACANVANLLLARGEERQREMAVRVAIGAERGRLARQVLTESAVLGVLGGAAGVGVAVLGTRLLLALDPGRIPRLQSVTVDGAALAFSAAAALATTLLFGALPALQAARTEVKQGLREGARGATAGRGRQRARRALVAAEVALAVVLVVGAGLMVRTFAALRAVDTGFDSAGVLTARLSLPSSTYPADADVIAFFDRLTHAVRALPGVRGAAAVRVVPLTHTIGDWSIDIEDYEKAPGENTEGDWQTVTPGYFEAMGLRLVAGRFFQDGDDATAAPVVIVNRTMAERYWPQGAVGRRFRTGSKRPWATIVGVVDDVRRNALLEAPRTEMYHPHAQYPAAMGFAPRELSLVIKTDGAPLALVPAVRAAVRDLDGGLPVSELRAMDDVVSASVAEQRFVMSVLAAFGVIALTLAAVGLYGVIAYSVARRGQEIGIRMALGAGRQRVVGLVVGDGLRLVGVGVVAGIVLAAALTRALSSLLYGVRPLDPLTFVVVPLVLAAAALVATALPALRASGVEPSSALRDG